MTWKADAEMAATVAFPRESCGLVVMTRGRLRYWPCRNVADAEDHFVMHPDDYAGAEDAGQVVAVVHSHTDDTEEPSAADRAACDASGLTWHIFAIPAGRWAEVQPDHNRVHALVGREFAHGQVDCYSLIRDWYRLERGLALPDFSRAWAWWERGESLYEDNFATAGFVECRDLREGDVLLMQIGRSPVPNHAGIWMADDTVLHHLHNRLSSRDPYDGFMRRCTRRMLRYVGRPAA